MKEIIRIIGDGKYYSGEYIKTIVLAYMEENDYSVNNEISEFYKDYIEGKRYYPISGSTMYKLNWSHNDIVATSELEEKMSFRKE